MKYISIPAIKSSSKSNVSYEFKPLYLFTPEDNDALIPLLLGKVIFASSKATFPFLCITRSLKLEVTLSL